MLGMASWGQFTTGERFTRDECWALRLGRVHWVDPHSRLLCQHVSHPAVGNSSLKVAVERAERLRQEVKKINLHHGQQLIGGLSLSLGVAAFPEHASSPASLLRIADLALYRAKGEGRDRVAVGEAPM